MYVNILAFTEQKRVVHYIIRTRRLYIIYMLTCYALQHPVQPNIIHVTTYGKQTIKK